MYGSIEAIQLSRVSGGISDSPAAPVGKVPSAFT